MIRRFTPLIIFIVLAGVLLWPVLFGGKVLLPSDILGRVEQCDEVTAGYGSADGNERWNPLTWDAIAFFYPSRLLLGESLRRGELPLWNPYQMCGTPFLANFQSAVLYPPNWLFGILLVDKAFGWLAFLHLLAAGGFTFIFLRGIGLSKEASLFGGAVFMLCGYMVVWLELPVFLSSSVWLPLALHFSRLAHKNAQVRYTIPAGIALALSLLGGHPQIAFYCWMAVAFYWVFLTLAGKQTTSLFRSAVLACFTFAWGICLAAPQLLPAMELAQLSHRGGTIPTSQGYAAYSSLAMKWHYLVMLFIPNFFGNLLPQAITNEYCGYVGVIPLILIGAAYRRKITNQHVWFFSGLLVLSLCMAMGTVINRVFYFLVPGFANSGSPARVLFIFSFAVIVLAAVGLDRLLSVQKGEKVSMKMMSLWPVMLLIGGVVFGHILFRQFGIRHSLTDFLSLDDPLSALFAVVLVVGCGVLFALLTRQISSEIAAVILLIVACADLLVFGVSFNPFSIRSQIYPRTDAVEWLKDNTGGARIMPLNDKWSLMDFPSAVLPPNSATAYGLRDVQGYDALYPLRYKALLDAAAGRDSCPPENGNMVFARNPESPVYDILGVKWFISSQPMPDAQRTTSGCYVLENKDTLSRAFMVPTVEYSRDESDINRIAIGDFDPRSVVLVPESETEKVDIWRTSQGGEGKPAPTNDTVTIENDGVNNVSISVTARKSGVLVLADQYYPGWKCLVDGKEAEVARVDYVLRGVAIPAGQHKVEFRFAPDSFDRGMRLLKAAITIIVCMMIYLLVRWMEARRPKPIPEPEPEIYPEDLDVEDID